MAVSKLVVKASLNTSGIEPTEFKVVVRPKVAEKKIGNIHLPEQVIERDQHAAMEGTLVAVSPLAFSYVEPWPAEARKPRPGDTVIFARYSGINQKGADGADYRIMNDKDIVAVKA